MTIITLDEAKQWYADADPVHDFDHVLRVYRIAERLARAEGGDLEIVRAAALLHDSSGSSPGNVDGHRAEHHIASADFAGEILMAKNCPEAFITAVQHCIRSHRYRGNENQPQTLEAQILFDADKLDVLGAVGAARTIAYAVLDGQPVYAEPSDLFLSEGKLTPEEPHSAYHEFLFKLRNVQERLFTTSGKALAADRHQYLVGFFAQLQAEVRGER